MNIFVLILKAVLFGITTGFILSIPIGPAAIESIKRTVSKGFKEGFIVSLGAISADVFYLLLINCGLANILSSNKKTESLFWIISGSILTLIGYNSIKHKNGNETFISKIMKNMNLSSLPFLTGFLITVSNPMTPSIWLTLSGTVLRAWYHINITSYYVFIISIIIGMILWFALLNFLAYKGLNLLGKNKSHKAVSFLMWTTVLAGLVFIGYGFYNFFNINIFVIKYFN
ncbi:LysE family translocator [Clostridium arbusti]|uniref:LysE family translocator n=1 Tax=Clostridium arbusti TaxID=1137848 RepID=UPI00028988B0|nr:LysE family transporter [Clostridium arbusti]